MIHSPTNSLVVLPPLFEPKESLEDVLYPLPDLFDEGMLKVSDLHTLKYAQFGNPKGVPILVVHGGPCAGCSPSSARHMDPNYYRIIIVDQRGAPASTPYAEMRENTTEHLIEDFEKLRKHLKVEKWILLGGSWGSTLSIAYGEQHPDVVSGFILRGIFLGSEDEFNQVWYGLGKIYPEAWEEFARTFPEKERSDVVKACYKRLMDPDPEIHIQAARAFVKYDLICSDLFGTSGVTDLLQNDKLILSVARAFTHYTVNKCFLQENQLLNNISTIAHLPCSIVQGRHDLITLPESAYKLHKNWPGSSLTFVQDAGHSPLDPSLSKALRQATDNMRDKHVR